MNEPTRNQKIAELRRHISELEPEKMDNATLNTALRVFICLRELCEPPLTTGLNKFRLEGDRR